MRTLLISILWIAATAGGQATSPAAPLQSPLIIVDDQHVDLEVPYSSGRWNLHVNAADDGWLPPDRAILHFNELTRTTRDSYESWIGAGPGQTIWVAGQDSSPGELYLGLAARGCDTLAAWRPADSRITMSFAYIQVALVGVRGFDGDNDPTNNPPAPGHFALWDTNGFGVKTAWMSTAEALPDGNFAYMIPGGHAHLSWGFTAAGLYEVDFQAKAYLGSGMTNLVASEVVTFYFGVERPLPGDANLDERVTDLDASILAAHWQAASPEVGWLEGDFDNNRAVTDLDASILAANWQRAGGSSASVPEPAAGLLALGGAIVLPIVRPRRPTRRPPMPL